MPAPLGNTNNRKGTRWRHAIEWALDHAEDADAVNKVVSKERALYKIALKLVKAAMGEDNWNVEDADAAAKILGISSAEWRFAVEEIGNRLDGRPSQLIGGDPELPPVTVLGVEFVKPDGEG